MSAHEVATAFDPHRAPVRTPSRPALVTWVRALAFVVVTGVLFAACTSATLKGPASTRPSASSAAGDPAPLVDPDQIRSGGPPPDGIPPIDDPKFLSPDEVGWLDDREPVLAVEIDGDARAYPIEIMIWHEIVNDRVGGVPVTVTYCPLCNTGVAFERPTVDGQLLDFGTSGKLYNSNLVMYDRQTETLWAQATGLAIMGPLTGTELAFVPARLLSWGDWEAAYPDGRVLSKDTGASRQYGTNPYGGYEGTENPFLFSGTPDPRLPATEHVLGVRIGSTAFAFPYAALRAAGSGDRTAVSARVGGEELVVFWQAGTSSALDTPDIASGLDVGAAAAFAPVVDGRRLTFRATETAILDDQTGSAWDITGRATSGPLAGSELEPLVAIDSFWFDWAAFHPDTQIYGG